MSNIIYFKLISNFDNSDCSNDYSEMYELFHIFTNHSLSCARTDRRKYAEAMGRYLDAFCMDPEQPLTALVLATHVIFMR